MATKKKSNKTKTDNKKSGKDPNDKKTKEMDLKDDSGITIEKVETKDKSDETPKTRKRGRPPGSKNKKADEETPQGKAISKRRKSPDDVSDVRKAIIQAHKDQEKLVKRWKKAHPNSTISAINPFDNEEGVGVRIDDETCTMLAAGASRGLANLLKVPSSAPNEESISKMGASWANLSPYLGLTNKHLAIIVAIGVTASVMLPILVHGIARLIGKYEDPAVEKGEMLSAYLANLDEGSVDKVEQMLLASEAQLKADKEALEKRKAELKNAAK